MRRYLGILILLILLAWLYARMGGFSSNDVPTPGTDGDLSAGPDGSDSLTHLLRLPSSEADVTSSISSRDDASTNDGASDADLGGEVNASGWEDVTVGRGQSFYVAMIGAGVSHEDIMALVKACKPQSDLRRVQAGESFRLQRDEDGILTAFHTELDAEHYLLATRSTGSWKTEIGAYPLQHTVKGVQGEIKSSLFEALVAEDADPQLAIQLSEILGWDIDFFRDLRTGDRFKLLYEEYEREGERVRDGRILAASFTNQGHEYTAYLYENALGFPAYYDDEGGSLEKQFLRAPLRYSRISSNFSRHRFHPIDHVYRAHYGVDYAAPRGTPVYATANGIVRAKSRTRANGNYIHLRHGNGYETYYLHLSRFNRKLHIGERVKQGDLIGFVGMTGKATAPHLDYRVKHNGKWLNPRKLDLPPAAPIAAKRKPEFMARRDSLRAELDRIPAEKSQAIVLDRETTPAEIEPSGR
jgi:murein DD-endopeptidase MepM/ murein hydrolase activator NlpD